VKPAVIIPTLNESDNLPRLVHKLKELHPEIIIIVVDDNSTDGTGEIAEELAQKYSGMVVIHRLKRKGIGAAIVDGFKKALELNCNPIFTMDGDLSHDPIYLNRFLEIAQQYDLIIGSRYISGVRVDGWRFRKLLISKLANMFVSYVMVKPIWDFTSGYRMYSAALLRQVDFEKVPPQGYLFQIHMVHEAFSKGFRVKEIPILYKDTEYNLSKIDPKDKYITFLKVFQYRAPILEILRHLTYLGKDYHRFVEEYEELLNPPPLKASPENIPLENPTISVGVMAYNEEKNIARCLEALENQQLSSGKIVEIIVVSSGSTDGTNQIVREFEQRNPLIRLVIQPERRGKANAINEFLKIAKGDICVVESADTVTEPNTIEYLIRPFRRPEIGMTGVHPIPTNEKKGFIGYAVHRLWELHHVMALEEPKCGEMVAFRNIFTKIPSYTAVDEAAIEALVREVGFALAYCPEAIVHNKGPENLRDFLRQRIRITTGHKHLYSAKGYSVATLKSTKVLKYVLKTQRWMPREVIYMGLLMLLEALARMIGTLNFYLRDKNPYVWDIAQSTKRVEVSKLEIYKDA